ncbi:MAG: hypothetical protein PWQ51_2193, partial [Methanolobus sp.]|nr:hypothetical protein [Methanolobus sp.]
LITPASAYVSYNEASNQITVHREYTGVNFTWLYEQINNDSLLTHDGKVWYLNSTLSLDDSVFFINSTDVSTLYMSNEVNNQHIGEGGLRAGDFRIKDVTIKSWYWSLGREPDTFLDETQYQIVVDDSGYLTNCSLYSIHRVSLNRVHDFDITNIIMDNSYGGFSLGSGKNITITNSKMTNFKAGRGIQVGDSSNIHIKDAYVDVATGGVVFEKCFDSSMENIFTNNTGWMGVEADNGAGNIVFKNIIVKNAYHNGLDLHGVYNVYVQNMSIYESTSNNILITGSGNYDNGGTWNVTLKDIYTYKSGSQGGTGIAIASEVEDVNLINVVTESETNGIEVNDVDGLNIINFTPINCNFGVLMQNMENVSIINSNLKDVTDSIYHNNDGATYVNSLYKNAILRNTAHFKLASNLDINVIDSGNVPVNGVLTAYVADNLDSTYGDVQPTQSFTLNEDGELDSSDIAPYLSYYYQNSSGYSTDLSYLFTLNDQNGNEITLTDITPDSTWYRENPNIPTYTITAIIPDSGNTEPQITGYAPSSDNPFTAGESKKFQVWADQELTTMKWYVNGNLVSSGSMDYTWKVESGSTTIMFSGFNSNGAVVQTWEITEGEIVEEAPVSSGTGLSFTPSASSLTATTGESTTFSVETTQEFTSAVWSVDGTEVETGTTGHVEAWTTAGTHTVTFDGTAAAGTISRSWTVVVSAAAESEYSSISISPSTTTVAPGESFSLDVYIDPTQALTGSQFDLQYSQLASISTVDEGDLFTASGLATTFQYDSISNAEGLLDNVYAAIVGSGTITSSGVMATIEMVAGSSSGVLDLGLSDVILSDANSNPAGYTVSNATVLIDTAPQFTSVSAQTVEEKQSLSFTVTANDADGDDLSYSSTSLPSGATFNDGSFSWTPSQGDAGSYVATFEVTDGYLTDTVSVSITVTPLNNLPEITLFEPADGSTFEEGSIIGVNVAATDADGDSLSYIIEIDSVKVSTATSYTWTTDYESAGTHTIKVTVSDGTDEVSSSGTITITDVQPRWDVNEDGTVNVLDITLVGQNYGQTYTENLPRWDVNQDGTVNIQDLSIVSGHFGETI